MKNSRKIKKRFLALLGCAALGAVLAPVMVVQMLQKHFMLGI